MEHNLPDSPFASPTKAAGGDFMVSFSNGPNEAIDADASGATANSKFGTSALLPPASALDMGTFKSYNCQIPRYRRHHLLAFFPCAMNFIIIIIFIIIPQASEFWLIWIWFRFSSSHGTIGMLAGTGGAIGI